MFHLEIYSAAGKGSWCTYVAMQGIEGHELIFYMILKGWEDTKENPAGGGLQKLSNVSQLGGKIPWLAQLVTQSEFG